MQDNKIIEKPMNMNYRESYAWQLGYNEGWKQCKESLDQDKKDDKVSLALAYLGCLVIAIGFITGWIDYV